MKIILFLLLFGVAVQPLLAQSQCEKAFWKTKYTQRGQTLNVLLIWFPIKAGTKTTLSLCASETGLPLNRHCAYNRVENKAKWEEIDENIELINCTAINKYCMEEPFEHTYTMRNNIDEHFDNQWKKTLMREAGDLQEPCLLSTGMPLTRRCEYNPISHMAQWEPLSPTMRNVSCLRGIREQVITYDLNNLYQDVQKNKLEEKLKPKQAMDQMTELLTNSQTVRIPADIKISSDILKIITEDNKSPAIIPEILNISDIIMDADPVTLLESDVLNATTSILKTIDSYLQNIAQVLVPTELCSNTTDGIVKEIVNMTSVFYINPSCSNISGLAIYNSNNRHLDQDQQQEQQYQYQHFDEHTGNYYRFLYLNHTLAQLLDEPDLTLATYFPLSLWNKLKTETGTVDNQTVITFIIFKNDLLFVNSTTMDKKPTRNILEIKIPNYTGELPEDLPFIFGYRRDYQQQEQEPNCGFWNYAKWLDTGIKTEYKNVSNSRLLICHSKHLTHFAALFGISTTTLLTLGDRVMLSISHDLMLDYISILGCGLSLLGLSFIWVTAIISRNFRDEDSSKVLLNICFVLSLLMIIFLLLNLPQLWISYFSMSNELNCQILGAFLHYIIMVLFFWMLILAIMQYQRYIVVLGYDMPDNFIIISAIAAWCLPLIPVCLVGYLEPNTYIPITNQTVNTNATQLCYPSGNSLIYGVVLPMSLIMFANLGIFIYIFLSFWCSSKKCQQNENKEDIIRQVRVSIFLFFLLGISWIFGLLSRMSHNVMFSYIFCLTSTLQGFVLFLHIIISDEQTRISWMKLCCGKNYRSKKALERAKYLNSKSYQSKNN